MTKTLTIDGIDADTFQRLETEANRRGVAMAVLACDLLRQSVDPITTIHHDLDSLAGTWTDEEATEFDKATAATRNIEPDLWR